MKTNTCHIDIIRIMSLLLFLFGHFLVISQPKLKRATLNAKKNAIELTFDNNVKSKNGNPGDFIVRDAWGLTYQVTAQNDDTTGDDKIILSCDLTRSFGDITISYENKHDEIQSLGRRTLSVATDDVGIKANVEPTIIAVSIVNNHTLNVLFDQPVTSNGLSPTDFLISDATGNYGVTAQREKSSDVQNAIIVLTTAGSLDAINGSLRVTYTKSGSLILDRSTVPDTLRTASYSSDIESVRSSLTPLLDAAQIRSSLSLGDASNSNIRYIEILQKYVQYSALNYEELITKNPFLRNVPELSPRDERFQKNKFESKSTNESQNSSTSFSFVSQGDALDGLGTFIANRFKQELNIAFLDKLKEKLKEQEELKLLLPVTHEFLINNEPYNYTSFLESLRSAFNEDLRGLPSNIPELVKSKKALISSELSLNNDEFIGLLLGLDLIKSYAAGESIAQILLNITGHDQVAGIADPNFKTAMDIAKMLTVELTNEVTKDWIADSELTKVFNNQTARFIFLGLLYEKYKKPLGNKISNAGFPKYFDKYVELYNYFKNYKNEIKRIDENFGSKPTHVQLIQYADLSIEFIDKVTDLSEIGIPQPTMIKNILVPHARKLLKIADPIMEKEYANAFVHTLGYIGEVLPDSPFKSDFVKYGNFAVNIVTAENSEAMVKALEAAALPVGSYKIKRNSFSNISLNAYAGVFAGHEWNKFRGSSSEPSDLEDQSTILGFTAPVGIAFSSGARLNREKKEREIKSEITRLSAIPSPSADDMRQLRKYTSKLRRLNEMKIYEKTSRNSLNASGTALDVTEKALTGASWSLFLSVLDVGAITAFRLTNDESATLPEVKFQNFLAPGIHVIHGLRNVPLSLSGGVQYGPLIRKIENLSSSEGLVSALSVRFSLLVDIPILNFYTKTEK